MPLDKTAPFPLDWNEWRKLWKEWEAEHKADLQPSSYQWSRKNMLANDILWQGRIGTRNVELSEVVMPSFGERPRRDFRYVGITFGTSGGTDTPDNPLVETFADLEKELGL